MRTLQIRVTPELLGKANVLVKRGIYSNTSEVFRDALRRLVYADSLSTSPSRRFKVIYTSDVHGNTEQYQKLFNKAKEEAADAVIIGGDIAPKDPRHRTPEAQRDYVESILAPLIARFNDENRAKHRECTVFLMPGNDDFKSTQELLRKLEHRVGFKSIHNQCIRIHECFKIAGYSNVPLTPFKYKDWEKLDLDEKEEGSYREGFIAEGMRTRANKFMKFSFDMKNRTDTIEKDLNRLLRHCDASKTVLVTHSPPLNTNLDVLRDGQHVGSAAVRKTISTRQPLLSLHGHIHETVDVSGNFKDHIGKTPCMTSGNDNTTNSLAVLVFDLFDVENARREIIA